MVRVLLRSVLAGALGTALLALGATHALAMREHVRNGWMFGVGIGYGEAKISTGSALGNVDTDWQEGSCPQIRIGRMIGRHVMASFDQRGWLDEQGFGDSKIRVGIQNFTAALTVFPGNPTSVAGGIYLRGGVGFSNSRLTVFQHSFIGAGPDSLDSGEHRDEGGVGYTLGGGYEFRVSRNLAAGVDVSANYQAVHDVIFDETWYFPAVLSLNWYFK
ncbi:MAG: hypothetical protein ACRENN_04960 [Candidatus Eiseniibacteriota bacterium]